MALCHGNREAIWKLLKIWQRILQPAIIPHEDFHISVREQSAADSKRAQHNLQTFVDALKSTDSDIKTVEQLLIRRVNRIDLQKISDPYLLSLFEEWEREQDKLKKRVIVNDTEEWAKAIDGDKEKGIKGIQHIGAVDVSFSTKVNPCHACAAYVIHKYPSLDVVYKDIKPFELTVPYIHSYFAFRELSPYLELIKHQRKEYPHLTPDVIMVDGNGVLHCKGFGMASHLGVHVDIPCIGVAKKLYEFNDLQVDGLKTQLRNLQKCGETVPLIGASGTVHGIALKSTDNARAIFVSSGHKISLDTAVNIVSKCCKYRIPEPIRYADLISGDYIRAEEAITLSKQEHTEVPEA